jgi:hypothetical protein
LIKESINFTQQSLKTFISCPYKFWLKYNEGIILKRFPSVEAMNKIQLGNQFHLLSNRYFLNIDTGVEYISDDMAILKKWMDNLKRKFPIDKNFMYLPEYKLKTDISTKDLENRFCLEANFDLIVKNNNELRIWDWKTGNVKKEIESWNNDFQTIVYLFTIGEAVNNKISGFEEYQLENIRMNYWKPESDGNLANIIYNKEKHEKYRKCLVDLLENIVKFNYSKFDMHCEMKHCKDCEFFAICSKIKDEISSNVNISELSWRDIEEIY